MTGLLTPEERHGRTGELSLAEKEKIRIETNYYIKLILEKEKCPLHNKDILVDKILELAETYLDDIEINEACKLSKVYDYVPYLVEITTGEHTDYTYIRQFKLNTPILREQYKKTNIPGTMLSRRINYEINDFIALYK